MDQWINSPLLKNMSPEKLQLIQTAASRTNGKSGKELAPIMLALITNANKNGIRFTPEEIDLILSILKEGKTKEEQAQIDRMITMIRSMIQKHS